MQKNKEKFYRYIATFLISPIIGVLIGYPVYFLASMVIGLNPIFVFASFFLGLYMVYFFPYIIMLVTIMPVIFLLEKFGFNKWYHYFFSGFLIAVLVGSYKFWMYNNGNNNFDLFYIELLLHSYTFCFFPIIIAFMSSCFIMNYNLDEKLH